MATVTDITPAAALAATTEAEAIALTLAYITELDGLAEQVGLALRDIFANLASTDRADIEAFIAEASPYTTAGVNEAADLAAAYLSEMTGSAITASDLVAPTIEWDGPFLRTWHDLSEGMPYAEAKEAGASMAEMTGYSATNDGATARMNQPGTKVRGWRRVISAKACEWCRVVSVQMYRTQESATFGHHGCKCTTVAVLTDNDPGRAINKARLEELGSSDAMLRERLKELKESGAIARANAARTRSRLR
jgi:hypothetical protein